MQKQPYIPFYIGDYIKDTRILPLSVRGAWMDLLLFMWNEKNRGEITATIEEFAAILSCTINECNFAIGLLIEKSVCSHEKLENGRIKIISRRMKKDFEISLKRSKSGKKGAKTKKNKETTCFDFAQAKPQQNPDNGYDTEIDIGKEKERGSGKEEEKLLCPQMVKVFKSAYPNYPQNEETDYPACLQIAYKIAKLKNWSKESVYNGKLTSVLEAWKSIVTFSKTDSWFSTRSISDFDKEFQRLIQKITNGNSNSTTKQAGNNQRPDENATSSGGFGRDRTDS